MSNRATRADRVTRLCLLAGFWLPLALCTWLALTPSPPDPVLGVSDVALHALAFSYLTFACGLAHPGARLPILAAGMLGYGLAIEVAQSFEPARSAEIKDLLVDVAGISAGLLLLNVLGAWSRRTVRSLLGHSLGG